LQRHFDADQWEKLRVDGERRLRNNAIPTILCDENPLKQSKKPGQRNPLGEISNARAVSTKRPLNETQPPQIDHCYFKKTKHQGNVSILSSHFN